MKTERITAKGIAAFIYFLLLMLPTVISAEETYNASLVSVETLDTGPWSNRVSVRIGNRVEHLLVSPHSQLNDLRIVTTDGVPVEQSGIAYAGIVESLPDSWARVVVEGEFVSGTINTGSFSTHFSSEQTDFAANSFGTSKLLLPPLTPPVQSLDEITGRTALSASQDSSPSKTLFNDGRLPDNRSAEILFEEIAVPISNQLTQTVGEVTRVARVGIVVDALYQEAIGGRGLTNAISTLNSVDGLYRENFGLALMVDVVVLLTDDTALPFNGNSLEDNLGLFRDYRIASELLPEDLSLVHLFSGTQSGDNAVGLAFSGAACRTDGYDVSMSRPFLFPVELAAHEIGHNLGADHDDATVECVNIVDHLMFSAINSDTTRQFSSCSSDAISSRLQQSTCYTEAINIGVDITQLESNQILATVTNLDSTRAFPSATLNLDLINATIAEAPALCELEDPSKLICGIPATFAGDQHDLAVKLRLAPEGERTITMRLEPNGFFDLDEQNNFAELVLPADPPPPPPPTIVNDVELTTQEVTQVTPTPTVTTAAAETSSGGGGGGGLFDMPLLWLTLLISAIVPTRVKARRQTATQNGI